VRVAKGTANVLLSRDAAKFLHSEDVLIKKKDEERKSKKVCTNDNRAGIKFGCLKERCFDNMDFLYLLEDRGVTASLGDALDDSIASVMNEFFDEDDEKKNEG